MCYDLDGNQKWERRLPLPENPYGAAASPIVAGELLVLNHQGKDSYLLGVNRRDVNSGSRHRLERAHPVLREARTCLTVSAMCSGVSLNS